MVPVLLQCLCRPLPRFFDNFTYHLLSLSNKSCKLLISHWILHVTSSGSTLFLLHWDWTSLSGKMPHSTELSKWLSLINIELTFSNPPILFAKKFFWGAHWACKLTEADKLITNTRKLKELISYELKLSIRGTTHMTLFYLGGGGFWFK